MKMKMKKEKILAAFFGILSVIRLCAMCADIALSYARMLCATEHCGASAPPSVAFLLAIPFGGAILISAALCLFFYKKYRSKSK